MNPRFKKQLGKTKVMLPRLGFGGGTMGDPIEIISEQQATDTMVAAYDRNIYYFDTCSLQIWNFRSFAWY